MMKTSNLLLLGMGLLLSCTNDWDHPQVTDEITSVVVTAKNFQSDRTSRTDFEITDEGAVFKWAENDTIGIFPDQGFQGYFPMTSGAGTNTAYFTGGGWALKPAATYAAYYPFIKSMEVDKTAVPVSYEGQTQTGNASTAHLGKYDFMAAVAKTPEQGKVTFDFEHLGAFVRLLVTLPEAGTYTSVTLNCDEAVFPSLTGKVDLTSAQPEIVATGQKSAQLTINLQHVVTTTAQEIVTVYFMTAPVDLTGKEIRVDVAGAKSYHGTVTAENLLAGYSYSLNVTDRPSFDQTVWVDLGLPSGLLWATKNVGAEKPEDNGDYFAWGETATKTNYAASTSVTYNQPMTDFSGNAQYDAATAIWGAPARMPKDTEIQELINHCTTTWATQNGVGGRLVTGPNGNSIFFPAAGYWGGTSVGNVGLNGYYWSSTPYKDNDIYAYYLNFGNGFISLNDRSRDYGRSVRPVRD